VIPFLAEVLTNRDDNGAFWVVWRYVTDPLDCFQTFELTGEEAE